MDTFKFAYPSLTLKEEPKVHLVLGSGRICFYVVFNMLVLINLYFSTSVLLCPWDHWVGTEFLNGQFSLALSYQGG